MESQPIQAEDSLKPSPIQIIKPCESPDYLFKKHACRFCSYRSNHPHVLRNHELKKHKSESDNVKSGTIIQSSETITSNIDAEAQPSFYNIQLDQYFKIFISGPSKSGKSYFVGELLSNLEGFTKKKPSQIIYIFSFWQKKFEEIRQLNLVDVFLQGGSELEQRLSQFTSNQDTLLIFDDQMNNKETLQYIANLFSVEARHTKLSLIFISQKIFFNSDSLRSIRENSDYWILFKNPKNVASVGYISSQMTKNSTLANIFTAATEKAHSYLFIDTRQEASSYTQYLSSLFNRSHSVISWVIEKNMNPYKKTTNFKKMILMSADKFEELEGNIDKSQSEGGENEINHSTSSDVSNGENPYVANGDVLPPAKMTTPEKRKREDDSEDDENPAQRIKLNTDIETVNAALPTETPSLEVLPTEKVEIAHGKRKRDIGLGSDDDGEKAASRRRMDNEEDVPTVDNNQPEVTPSPTSSAAFPHTCETCGKSLKTAAGLKTHKSRMHFIQPDLNSQVETLDEDDIDMLARKKSLENKRGHCFCKICKKHFTSQRLFNKHVNEEHVNVKPDRISNVLEDDYDFEDRQKNNRKKVEVNKKMLHKQKYESNDEDSDYTPTKSNKKTFAKKKNMRRGAMLQMCNLCKQTFKSGKELKLHFQSSHQ